MRYSVQRLLGVCVLLGVVGCSPRAREGDRTSAASAPEATVSRSMVVPDVKNPDRTIDLETYRGKVVLLDFWATWCAPCRAEQPALNGLYNELKDRGFVLVGMTMDEDDPIQVADRVRSMGLDYPVGLAGADVREMVGGVRAVPTKVLLDGEGRILERYVGVVSPAKLRADVEPLLSSP